MGSLLSTSSPFLKDPAVYATIVTGAKSEEASTYDYVIVGGGTAACVLAHRLTEDPAVSVLMIEAGESNEGKLFTRMPATFTMNFKTKIDWGYTTTEQLHAQNRSFYWPAGKLIGGGSSINSVNYQRPCADDMQEWNKNGVTGWDFDDFKGYLNKAEKYTLHPDRPNIDVSHRGKSGLWFTSHPKHYPVADNFVDACEQVGIPRITDISRPEGPVGATFMSGFIDQKGERSSAAKAYLTPAALARPNLTVAVEASVTRILFTTSEGKPRAVGVELAKSSDAPRYRVAARREVLCCAGAIRTPQILAVSGIGPSDELKSLGVPIVKEIDAVGKNLYDHAVTSVAFRAKAGTTMDPLVTPTGALLPVARWLMTGGGPFAMLGGQACAFVRSTDDTLAFHSNDSKPTASVDVTSGPSSPDLEYLFAPLAYLSHGFTPTPPRANICTIATVLLRPQSCGTITLKSASVWDKPIINPNYFAVENDLDTFVRGMRLSLRIARSEAFKGQLQLKSDVEESNDIYFPGDADPDNITDEALKRFIQRTAETCYHPMGTARMGHSPATSVVDHALRVHGVSNLRVIDASIFPAPMATHPCATVIGVAEKAADMLKATVW